MVPSFREFLEWLLRQPPGHDDVHWDQYHTHCAVCNVRYNFILKLPRLQRTRAGITDFDVTCKYFSDLTTDMVLRLYKRYKIDFEMYNYKLEKYLHCARGKKLT